MRKTDLSQSRVRFSSTPARKGAYSLRPAYASKRSMVGGLAYNRGIEPAGQLQLAVVQVERPRGQRQSRTMSRLKPRDREEPKPAIRLHAWLQRRRSQVVA